MIVSPERAVRFGILHFIRQTRKAMRTLGALAIDLLIHAYAKRTSGRPILVCWLQGTAGVAYNILRFCSDVLVHVFIGIAQRKLFSHVDESQAHNHNTGKHLHIGNFHWKGCCNLSKIKSGCTSCGSRSLLLSAPETQPAAAGAKQPASKSESRHGGHLESTLAVITSTLERGERS
jgi:hypothetical protein